MKTRGMGKFNVETKTVVRILMLVMVIIAMISVSIISNEKIHKEEATQLEVEKAKERDKIRQELNMNFDLRLNKTMNQLEEIELKLEELERTIDENEETIQELQSEELEEKELSTTAYEYNLSENEYVLLLKLVESESTGEPYKGKIAVTNVLFNRIEDEWFPDTIQGVVHHKINGRNQFSVVSDNRINTVEITQSTIDAVDEFLEQGTNVVEDSLYFMNRKWSSPNNIEWFDKNLEFVTEIGEHEFFRKPDNN